MRPSNGRPSWAGSTRHSPSVPSTTAGSPASPTWIGSPGRTVPFAAGDAETAEPALVADRPGPPRAAPPRRPRGRPARRGRTSSGCPSRPFTATSPRASRQPSIIRTLRSTFHPDDCHGTWAVAWTSRDGSGPSASRMSSTSLRNSSLASSQSRVPSHGGQIAMSARCSAQVGHRADAVAVLVEVALGQQVVEVLRLVRRPQPRPADQVVARGDRPRRLDRERRQPLDHRDTGRSARGVEHASRGPRSAAPPHASARAPAVG